jgi:hypothetical protein
VEFGGDGIGKTLILAASPENGINAIGSMSNRVAIHDLSVTMDPSNRAATMKDGVKFAGVVGARVENVYVENCYLGMNFVGCSDVDVIGSRATACRTGFMVDMQATFWSCDGIRFVLCEADHTAADGGIPYGFAIYADAGDDAHRIKNVSLDRCYVHDNEQGVYAKWTDRLTVTGTRIENNGWAFYVVDSRDYWSLGNTAAGNESNAMPYNAGGSNARAAA